MKDILFIFFNGGGNTLEQWYKHPYENNKETDLIERIKLIGDIFLYNPVFYYDGKNQKTFKLDDINFDVHCKMLKSEFNEYNYYFLISHSRGWMLANHFAKKNEKKVIGMINFDGGETLESVKKHVEEWKIKYDKYGDSEIQTLIEEINGANKESHNILSNVVKYRMYLQYLNDGIYQPKCKTVIFNNIYDNKEINIEDEQYVKLTLNDKFKYNALFRENSNVTSKWYVSAEKYGHFVYFMKEDEIINEIKKITCPIFPPKEIYIIRHGQTDWNKKGIPQGAGNDIDLNGLGRHQATKTGIYLRETRLESGPFDLILSSPMSRAMTTAKLIAKEIQYTKPIIILNELTELDFGLTASGKTTNEMRQDPFYDEYYKLHDERKKLDKIKRREILFDDEPEAYNKKYKIESTKNVVKRMEYIKNYILQHSNKKIIIVTHGGTIDWLHRIILNTADYLGAVKNCSIAYYKVENCVFNLLMVSSDEHLETKNHKN